MYVCVFTFIPSRNLHKEAKFEGSSSSSSSAKEDASTSTSSTEHTVPPVATSPEVAEVASRTTFLTPMAMSMFGSRNSDNPAAAESSGAKKDDVQGLTQMYYLEEGAEEEAAAAAATVGSSAVGVAPAAAAAFTTASHGPSSHQTAGASVGVGAALSSDESSAAEVGPMFAEPQGLTQVFFLDPEMEAEAVAALPVVPGRSFLRERLGVPGEVVQDLRQVGMDVWMGGCGLHGWLNEGLWHETG